MFAAPDLLRYIVWPVRLQLRTLAAMGGKPSAAVVEVTAPGERVHVMQRPEKLSPSEEREELGVVYEPSHPMQVDHGIGGQLRHQVSSHGARGIQAELFEQWFGGADRFPAPAMEAPAEKAFNTGHEVVGEMEFAHARLRRG